MGQKDIQDYLDKGMYGSPKIKPDEQKKYLGTFRERVVFVIRLEEASKNIYDHFCINQFSNYPKGTLLINANCPLEIQNHFMKIAQARNILFRLVDTDEQKIASDAIAIVFSLDKPANIEDIFVKSTTKLPPLPKAKPTNESNTFFKRLFKI